MNRLTALPPHLDALTEQLAAIDFPLSGAARNLARLESESLVILWEVLATLPQTGVMFSGGKDSACVAHLIKKACTDTEGNTRVPFPFFTYDSGNNFPEVLDFIKHTATQIGTESVIYTVSDESNAEDVGKIYALIKLINQSVKEHELHALIGGGRRDEEIVRAKERIFSLRNAQGGWDPHDQRPEPWGIYNTTRKDGEHFRVFPISNWTERNVWEYIEAEKIELPSLYYAHTRPVVRRNGTLLAVFDDTILAAGEQVKELQVRCRTAGDRNTTGFIESQASNAKEVLAEILATRTSERAGRVEDKGKGTDMESRKRQGWA